MILVCPECGWSGDLESDESHVGEAVKQWQAFGCCDPCVMCPICSTEVETPAGDERVKLGIKHKVCDECRDFWADVNKPHGQLF